ncbi:nucleotide exchange factor GrpE [Candidatus Daviesbacteria bacterium RIFCSPLOWO2_01_FULL_43_38]|uniref:Protein GrpE n=2 Tax=Candidatus Daviesiibacteriota TaxID=1752718 RepID=A0A1F5K530_9BACT|nr:MAG: Protein GrpE [Candidatus Daviesbacteria bacterium GW2011_GWA2_42_7]OGE20162.1 MAG: nucleotide exchange factor GrpE [Candidatus Daviesbacteria bacterium RIFCSPHIGHO2_01_FULL_43_17]OGE36073.1 MAG: nucleotide exchange factor GrpE [Candidatus Daviesbacteria bacterium RIFCSPHIGHO2_12_FULL_43_11]OGE63965.1 MAG: nucleotide exchange factor GrpE [Candidatus Daviesbacteria bacterium RIFCSPLOWO2_01_FULL_43_38]OGE68978.1 MAG: nucleotide exchange factor GrpE [Candidatus Daviesbacteria bacterium RIFC
MVKKTDAKKLEEELVNLEAQLKRALADYRNLERRVQDDVTHFAHHSRAELLMKLLPVLDSLDTAVSGVNNEEAQSGWLQGVAMAVKQLRQVLAEEGLNLIEVGENFDPNLHEAVDVREGMEGKVLQVVQNGYILNSKVIRPARVVVGKGNPPSMEEEQES